jgi:acyl-CoA hydrolase
VPSVTLARWIAVELRSRVVRAGRSSMLVEVKVRAESAAEARDCGTGPFRMIAVDAQDRPVSVPRLGAGTAVERSSGQTRITAAGG